MTVSTAGLLGLAVTKMVLANSAKLNPYLHGSARGANVKDIEASGLLPRPRSFWQLLAGKALPTSAGVYVGGWLDTARCSEWPSSKAPYPPAINSRNGSSPPTQISVLSLTPEPAEPLRVLAMIGLRVFRRAPSRGRASSNLQHLTEPDAADLKKAVNAGAAILRPLAATDDKYQHLAASRKLSRQGFGRTHTSSERPGQLSIVVRARKPMSAAHLIGQPQFVGGTLLALRQGVSVINANNARWLSPQLQRSENDSWIARIGADPPRLLLDPGS